ncbi:MAG TPA: pentapeptide repeat-containing protein [Pyrinomonadaceae bacterium]
MADSLITKLNLSAQEKKALGKTTGGIKSVTTFLCDVIDAVKGSQLAEGIGKAVPWAAAASETVVEVVPPVKFAVKLISKLSEEHDAEALGQLACTLAYQSAIEQTVKAVEVPIVTVKEKDELKKQLAQLEPSKDIDFSTFAFDNALTHEFVRQADAVLQKFAEAFGYDERQRRQLINGVHFRFTKELKKLLSNGELEQRFRPFTKFMELGTKEQQAYQALREHAEYQLRQFEEEPLFNKEPFALSDIYVETECGDLSWGEINNDSQTGEGRQAQKQERVDPFAERFGERKSLVDVVMGYIGDAKYDDAIVIQGVAGSGKSSFTLRLCAELIKEGLSPIRVRLRDLQLDKHLSERLPEAVLLSELDGTKESGAPQRPDDLFLNDTIFKQKVKFRSADICPYVLILDGWDEISISATEGFKIRVAKMLEQLRSSYLTPRDMRVRVILTGRPSNAVSESDFLRDKTRVLTIRPLRPEHLEKFVKDLSTALEKRPIHVAAEATERWNIPDLKRFETIFETYRKEYDATTSATEGNQPEAAQRITSQREATGSMAVLGLPLLAFLAIRLLSQWRGDLPDLVANPTTLYRSLIDLTCVKTEVVKGGKKFDVRELRSLLQRTAEAMTVYGQESIPYEELSLRLEEENLDEKAQEAMREHVLTALIINFFFKGGLRHLGCEFLHKSFREYLFAERIIETLKEYGSKQERKLPEREPYWKDFTQDDANDFRFEFSRKLSALLAPQWLSPEVVSHVEQLIIWEIARSQNSEQDGAPGNPTDALDFKGWTTVRDGLADLWDWWAEGVHLRPTQTKNKSGIYETGEPYVQELIMLSAPRDYAQRRKPLELERTLTPDARLGDGLFRISALVHFRVAAESGWLHPDKSKRKPTPAERWAGVSDIGAGPRKHQSEIKQGEHSWVMFASSGMNSDYFVNYCYRINSAGWRPHRGFPLGVNLSGVDLSGARIVISFDEGGDIRTIWNYANLFMCNGTGSDFSYQDFREVLADGADLFGVYFFETNLRGTYFRKALLNSSDMRDAIAKEVNFSGARLVEADFNGAYLGKSKFVAANLISASLKYTLLSAADLRGANCSQVTFTGANLRDVIIDKNTKFTNAIMDDVVDFNPTPNSDAIKEYEDEEDDLSEELAVSDEPEWQIDETNNV